MKNPEFRRNLWLELSPYRLMGMPAVLAAVFLLVYVLSGETARDTLAIYTLILYGALVFLWGTRQASESVVVELRDRTWDWQRMSSIGPWSMTWGKLLGSAVYPWYGGLLCLAAYIVLTLPDPRYGTFENAALFLVCGLFAHAAALLASLQAMVKERRYNRSQTSAFLVLAVLFAGPFLATGLTSLQSLTWMGMIFRVRDWSLISVVLFLGWAVFGIYRLMRAELQMRNGALAWLAFSVFLAFYAAGFQNAVDAGERAFDRSFTAYAVLVLAVYVMAFGERKDPVAFRRLVASFGRREWRRVLELLPCWTVTLLPLVAAAILTLLFAGATGTPLRQAPGLATFLAASLLFLLRDLGLMLFLNLAQNRKRADMLLLLNLVLLYGVVPGIVSALDLTALTGVFWPRWDVASWTGVLASGLEAVLVLALLQRRWRGYAERAAVK
jgi:hypothetical protein